LGVYKPKADFYTGILKELGTDASDALFVGDSLLDDIWGPQQIGIKTCWVNRNGAKYENIKPDFQVNNLTEIINILGLD
jgi:putative hydrolase of the HAD superfamily